MSNINWKEFEYTSNGITMNAKYWDKDFTIYYKSAFGVMSYGLHLMYMIPRIYSEEEIKKWCENLAPSFKDCELWVFQNKAFLQYVLGQKKEIHKKNEEFLENYKKLKQELKRQFKNKEFTEKEYHSKIKIITQEIRNMEANEADFLSEELRLYLKKEDFLFRFLISFIQENEDELLQM